MSDGGTTLLTERTELLAREGAEAEMLAMMTDRGVPLLAKLPGVVSVQFGQGIENPDKFLLLVEWENMAAHTAFTQAPSYGEFRAMLMPLSRGGAMEHFALSRTPAA